MQISQRFEEHMQNYACKEVRGNPRIRPRRTAEGMKGWRSTLHTVVLGGPFAFGDGEAPFRVAYRGQRGRN